MSASDKLKALSDALGGEDAAVGIPLPEITAVVEAAERMESELNAHGLSAHVGEEECAAGYVLGRTRAALDALDEALG